MLEQTKLKKYEDAFKAIRGDSKDGKDPANTEQLRARIVELTKQNAINEANLMKMGRKYQALDEQWKLLSRDYHAQDGELAEKDVFVQKRINKLKEWKTDAILQLRLLFDKLQNAVPLVDFESLKRKNDLDQQKNNTLQLKNIDLIKNNAEL